jgi:hypothetical protein
MNVPRGVGKNPKTEQSEPKIDQAGGLLHVVGLLITHFLF